MAKYEIKRYAEISGGLKTETIEAQHILADGTTVAFFPDEEGNGYPLLIIRFKDMVEIRLMEDDGA